MTRLLSREKHFANVDCLVENIKEVCLMQNDEYSAKLAWTRISSSCVEISEIAIAILSICPSESAVERSWRWRIKAMIL